MGIVLNYSPVSYNVKSPLNLTFFINLGVVHKQHVMEKKSKKVSRIQMHRLIFASERPKFAHVCLGARRYENWAKSRRCPLQMWLRYRWVTLQLPGARHTFIAGLSVLHFKIKFVLSWCQMSRMVPVLVRLPQIIAKEFTLSDVILLLQLSERINSWLSLEHSRK